MIRRNLPLSLRLAPLNRGVAWLAVAVVLMLSFLAASPETHEHLHADAGQAGHACSITLFAQGVTTDVATTAIAVVVWRLLNRTTDWREMFVEVPAFVHLPGRAPPLG